MGGTSDIEALDRQVKDRGYCIIEDVIPADVVAGISADVLAVDPMHNRADAPYADVLAHLTSIWMLTDFTEQNGATLIVPNSHRQNNNPTGNNGVDPMAPHLEEIQIIGAAGTVMVMDSRVWHATPTNEQGWWTKSRGPRTIRCLQSRQRFSPIYRRT